MAEVLSWKLPKINIGKIAANGGAPSEWLTEFDPVENSAKLTPTEGKEYKAPIEGGELESYERGASTYVFEYEVRVSAGRTPKIESHDGVTEDEYAVQLIPNNPLAKGFLIDRARVNTEDTWDAENGAKIKYVFNVLKAPVGDAVKWGVQTDKTAES